MEAAQPALAREDDALVREKVRGQAEAAKAASAELAILSSEIKDKALLAMAGALKEREGRILEANAKDIEAATAAGLSRALTDRLLLTVKRVTEMAEGLRAVAALPDPVGGAVSMWRRPNGLEIARVRVPLGVIGIIYEARPNVTADAIGLCLKVGNAAILRGGSEAINSNREIVDVLSETAYGSGIPPGSIQFIDSRDRRASQALMRMNGLVDVLIPRGGHGLIKTVVETATVPVIETGVGNCHIYIDESADLDMAVRIVVNAKTQRPAVCNAMETLLVHRSVASSHLPVLARELEAKGVELRGCELTRMILPHAVAATEEDWRTEYLDLILAVKVVAGLEEAMEHIRRYGTQHSEAIVTGDLKSARRFAAGVDAAAVYVNTSTRFTDGYQFGLGAEIGISTQKLHARGPMGLDELTSTKFVIFGDGQVRE